MLTSANKLLPVAKVIKSFGTKGQVIIRFAPTFQEEINPRKPVFITFDELPVPFFIESITSKGANQSVVKLKGIDNIDLAEEITGQDVMTEYSTLEAEEPNLADFIGFHVEEPTGAHIGTVTDFYDYPNNPCFEITLADKSDKKILLPVHEHIVLGSDSASKTIFAQLPEGLLDL